MNITVREYKTVDVDEKQMLKIAREVLLVRFGMPDRCCINDDGELEEIVEIRDHDYHKVIRKATDRDRLYFAVMDILNKAVLDKLTRGTE